MNETKSTKSNTGFRNGALFCFNCGGEFKQCYPMPVDVASNQMKSFADLHRDCKKTWVEPVLDGRGKTEEENAAWWLLNGEHGISSRAMFSVLSGKNVMGTWGMHHPCDPDDFKRCYKLLQAVPQWKSRLYKMNRVSPVWQRLVENWDKLTEMYEQNVREDWKNYKQVGMYEFMQSLGC